MRKWLKPKQNPEEYARLAAELTALLKLEDENKIKLYFADESGFSLNPTIPYGWQPIGETIGIVPQKSKRLNVFGLMNRQNDFVSYSTTQTIDAKTIVANLDDFASKITGQTVVVMDNATIHKAGIVKEKIKEWAEKGMTIWHLPTYSPNLNIIETLWRKIKYEWLKPQDYFNWVVFENAINKILVDVGTIRTIILSLIHI